MYWYKRGIDFASFCDISIGIWNYLDSVVVFVFPFLSFFFAVFGDVFDHYSNANINLHHFENFPVAIMTWLTVTEYMCHR